MDARPPPPPDSGPPPGEPAATAAGARAPVRADPDPEPQPPREPALTDCCGSGCTPCIVDLYHDALERHEAEHARWRARQAGRGG